MRKSVGVISSIVLLFALAGCGTTANNTSTSSNTTSMGNMVMGNQTSTTQSTSGLAQAFQDELNGFNTIENDLKKNDYQAATALADNLHNEFHAMILGPLKEKKGTAYAEDIHSKYDELQDAIQNKDTAKIGQLIKVNRDNLYTVAQILGVPLQK
ncbi:hypothetical protein [Alicyclobacillus contaminans]|uniref:hypothetical protein n=1 Tax=Alicyclobacillus contaminans TaxID=392016 RepID=UPI00047AC248|nr:hypothetical protein [Alicyclobacillus contaminans]